MVDATDLGPFGMHSGVVQPHPASRDVFPFAGELDMVTMLLLDEMDSSAQPDGAAPASPIVQRTTLNACERLASCLPSQSPAPGRMFCDLKKGSSPTLLRYPSKSIPALQEQR